MQKLERRNTYTPTGIPHTRSNCDLLLNGEETPCVAGLENISQQLRCGSNCNQVCRTGLASSCHSYLEATESGTRQPIRYSAINIIFGRGTPDYKSGVSTTPAPHGVL
jgi:hypothetical protein